MTGSVLELDDIPSGVCAFGLPRMRRQSFQPFVVIKFRPRMLHDAARSRCQR